MEPKLSGYIVAPHQNRGGGVSRRCWDVRIITLDEFGIQHDGGKIKTFQTQEEARQYIARRNRKNGGVS